MKLRCVDNEGIESWLTLGNEYEVMEESCTSCEVIGDDGVVCECCKSRFELVEEPTEFTFQEVVVRIKPGEVYEPVNGLCITQTITMDYEKDIIIDFLPNKSFAVLTCTLFKLQEPKKKVNIYRVEHKQDGKKYDFISSQLLQEGMIVVCDTSQGKSYGRIVDIIFKELTEEEIKQYKECWRA